MPEIFQLIEQASKKLKQFQRRTIQESNLTPPQYFILSLLWEKDGAPFKDLASASFSSRATITGIVDTLEKKGLVTREPNHDDRRSLLVSLTGKGKKLRQSTPTLETIFRSCCSSLDLAEIQQLTVLLKKLNDTLPF
ncbi:MAG: MarR family transcriptional regulator [Anaerolineales bacterium]|nr:MarR family transcriptional regulator [Anaerolineales bacterium]